MRATVAFVYLFFSLSLHKILTLLSHFAVIIQFLHCRIIKIAIAIDLHIRYARLSTEWLRRRLTFASARARFLLFSRKLLAQNKWIAWRGSMEHGTNAMRLPSRSQHSYRIQTLLLFIIFKCFTNSIEVKAFMFRPRKKYGILSLCARHLKPSVRIDICLFVFGHGNGNEAFDFMLKCSSCVSMGSKKRNVNKYRIRFVAVFEIPFEWVDWHQRKVMAEKISNKEERCRLLAYNCCPKRAFSLLFFIISVIEIDEIGSLTIKQNLLRVFLTVATGHWNSVPLR